jgi:peptide/nickel transport system substrate-binding protein
MSNHEGGTGVLAGYFRWDGQCSKAVPAGPNLTNVQQAAIKDLYGKGGHMRSWRHKLAVFIIAATVIVLGATGCGSSASLKTSGSDESSGGTASYSMLGVQPDWIWPFTPASNYSVTNTQVFQWLMYRPLYMFGDDGVSTAVNYVLSPARTPVYSDGGRTVVINLKDWKWSDGERVDAQDVVFWLNMMRAEKANYAGYSPGLLPDNLASYSVTGADQVTLHLDQAYSDYWFTYNQLAEITPMPEAWDVTSLSGKPGSGGCAVSVSRCAAVFKFLTAQAKDTAGYTASRLWGTVDGPWRLKSFSAAGTDAFVPNSDYSGTPKPHLAEFKLVSYSSDQAAYAAMKSGKLTVGAVPPQELGPRAAGSVLPAQDPLGTKYSLIPYYQFGIYYYILNFNNPALGPVFRQLYVRQALQEAEDQPGMDTNVFHGYAVPGSGPVPAIPANAWEPAGQKANGGSGGYPFSASAAKALLTGHGWRALNGVMTCEEPGTGASQCGAGIPRGRKLAFTIDWATGVSSTQPMMDAYKADAAQVGIAISLVSQPFQQVLTETVPCSGAKCSWSALYYGNWVFNGPGFEPTGESLFETGAPSNSGSYSNQAEDALIAKTHTISSLAAFQQYAAYTAEQLPFIWMPDQYSIWGASSKLHNVHLSPLFTLLPEYWYYTK